MEIEHVSGSVVYWIHSCNIHRLQRMFTRGPDSSSLAIVLDLSVCASHGGRFQRPIHNHVDLVYLTATVSARIQLTHGFESRPFLVSAPTRRHDQPRILPPSTSSKREVEIDDYTFMSWWHSLIKYETISIFLMIH